MAFCMECGTRLGPRARSCPSCGHPVDEPRGAPVVRDLPSPPPPEGDVRFEGAGVLTARIVGIFAVIGLGLGVGALLFLWATGFFEASDADGIEELDVALGAIALGVVSAFAVLIGIVVAAMGGVLAANNTERRVTAAQVGAIGAAAGHLALIVVLGGCVIGALALRSALSDEPGSPQQDATTAQEIADCERIFGAGEAMCRQQDGVQGLVEDDGTDDVDLDDIARLGLGIIPATLVGALAAALTFSRRPQRA